MPADNASGSMSVLDALKGVLKISLIHDGLARGLREASKALDRRQAHMCVLNEACEEEAYKKLVVALCGEHKIPLIKVPDGKQLGEWAGLCKFFLTTSVVRDRLKHCTDRLAKQARLTARATPARSSTALASSSRTGVRSPRSAASCSTTSRPSSKRRLDIPASKQHTACGLNILRQQNFLSRRVHISRDGISGDEHRQKSWSLASVFGRVGRLMSVRRDLFLWQCISCSPAAWLELS